MTSEGTVLDLKEAENQEKSTKKSNSKSTRTRSNGSKKSNSKSTRTRSNGSKTKTVASATDDDGDGSDGVSSVTNEKETSGTPILKTSKRKRGQARPQDHKEETALTQSNSFEASWNERDKQRLLIALQRHGILEMDEILKAVPGKSENEIRMFIRMKWKYARSDLHRRLIKNRQATGKKSQHLGPIDKWLEILYKDVPNYDPYKVNPIAHAVLLIWKYEKHPDPSECGGIDFKALYEHLYYLLCGYPPKHLNQPTALYLQETMKEFAIRVKNTNATEEQAFLSAPVKINTQTTSVSEDDVISALSFSKERCFDELLKLPGFNPFCVPKELLKKKEPVYFEYKSSQSSVQQDLQPSTSNTDEPSTSSKDV